MVSQSGAPVRAASQNEETSSANGRNPTGTAHPSARLAHQFTRATCFLCQPSSSPTLPLTLTNLHCCLYEDKEGLHGDTSPNDWTAFFGGRVPCAHTKRSNSHEPPDFRSQVVCTLRRSVVPPGVDGSPQTTTILLLLGAMPVARAADFAAANISAVVRSFLTCRG